MAMVAAEVADIGRMSFLHLCCRPVRRARAGATTRLDFGRVVISRGRGNAALGALGDFVDAEASPRGRRRGKLN